jgi:hypothetical protein
MASKKFILRVYFKKLYTSPPGFILLFRKPVLRIYRFCKLVRPTQWILSGNEISSEKYLAIKYIGNEIDKQFWGELIFGKYFHEECIGRAWFWQIIALTDKKIKKYSLLIIGIPKILRLLFQTNFFYIPCWIQNVIYTSEKKLLSFKSHSLKMDIKKIKKNQYEFSVTKDHKEFENFYYNMHVPFIRQQHGKKAVLMEYDFLKNKLNECELLLISKNKENIAGVLIHYHKGEALLWIAGIKNANIDYFKKGITGTLYYFPIIHCIEKGIKKINLGGTKPFFKNGIFQYKKKWAPEIAYPSYTGFLLKQTRVSASANSFFINNPFISHDKSGVNCSLFTDLSQSDFNKKLKKFIQENPMKGLSEILVYPLNHAKIDKIDCSSIDPSLNLRICQNSKRLSKK